MMAAEREVSGRRGDGGSRHEVFLIGRICKGEQKLVFLDPQQRPVFPGPWKIRAVLVD